MTKVILRGIGMAVLLFSSCLNRTSRDYYTMGQEEFISENYEATIQDMTMAISLQSDFAKAYFVRGEAYYNLKNYTKASADYSSAIEYNPSLAVAFRFRGVVKATLGDTLGAYDDWHMALKLGDTRSNFYLHKYKRQRL
jgi:tetratricopeptide (TPR) repeat protein